MFALTETRQVEKKRPIEKYAWYDTRSRHASQRQSPTVRF